MTLEEYKTKIKENEIKYKEIPQNTDELFNHLSDEVVANMCEREVEVRDATFYCLLSLVLKVKVTK